jgi:hypothetical protein
MINERKTTAINWFLAEIEKLYRGESKFTATQIRDKAREMDKEQKKDAWYDCYHNGMEHSEDEDPAETYFNQTYKS